MKRNSYSSAIKVLLFLFLTNSLLAQTQRHFANPWQDTPEKSFAQKRNTERQIVPKAYRTTSLDWSSLQSLLQETPMRFTAAASTKEVILALPMPDGTSQQFRVVNAPVLHKDLAKKYPGIHAYAGQGIDDPTAYLRFDVTPQGFHAMVLTSKSSSVFIDPYAKGDTEHYISYYKKDFVKENDEFVCHVNESVVKENRLKELSDEEVQRMLAGDCQLRRYRLALACTGEYTSFHGGTVAGALAAMNTSMTRVNGVFERDAGITMEIIANNDEIIFLNGNNDPYNNGNGGQMLGQNQTTIDNEIGSANYDIGHVFSTGGGGIASLNSPCSANRKAQGVTGQPNPVNDPFDIDYVAHEMGHQYGGNHTQNNNCQRTNASVEPGSASTIMGYAGICNPNVQNNSDDYFHIINIREMADNIIFGTSSGCPVTMNTGNNQPVANAGSDYTIPVSTPFALTGEANDPDGNQTLTYSWEQMDPQPAQMPPQPTNTGGPAFRSIDPSTSPTRYFPNLNAIISNNTPTWEVLPSVSRVMNFTFTARDNNMGNGCTGDDDARITTTNAAGPFLVIDPNTNETWFIGDSEEVLWDVANTDAAPVNCANVDILLSIDGGQTYPITLAESVPNNGSALITVPNELSNDCRVRINCSDNIFFDISNTDFTIEEPPFPTFNVNSTPDNIAVCAEQGEVTYTLNISSIAGFEEEVSFLVMGLPDGADSSFDPAMVTPSGVTTLTVSNLAGVAAGNYTLTIEASSETTAKTTELGLQVLTSAPAAPALNTPENGEDGVSLLTTLLWEEMGDASSYQIEIATNPAFGDNVIENATVSNGSYSPENLEEGTVYYWRVIGTNDCGEGEASGTFAFQTGTSSCQIFASDDVPVGISLAIETISSTLTIAEDKIISDVNVVNLDIDHSWVGDLDGTLLSPDGSTVTLFDRPGVDGGGFGCGNANILVDFDDEASMSANDFENTCDDTDPAIGGSFQSIGSLSDFDGESSAGEWTLTITDNADQDGGELVGWGLEICFEVATAEIPAIVNQILTVTEGGGATITNEFLSATSTDNAPEQMIFTITEPPKSGTLQLNGMALGLGDTFTQADIDNGLLVYVQDGPSASSDTFLFDVINSTRGWSSGNVFNINILTNDLSVAVALQSHVSCAGGNDGAISADPAGGTAPFMYSLDGENFQESNVFEGLNAGTYTITVMDANGLQSTSMEIEVTEPEVLALSASSTNDNITAEASGGTGAYQYSIDGENFQESNTFSGLENGLYTVTAMDANGCTATTEVVVANNTIVVGAVLTNGISCANANDATITATANGGVEPYQYSIDGENFQNSNVFENLGAGTYVITAMDVVGFSAQSSEIVITNPDPLMATSDLDENTLTVNASGGTGDLTYSIDGENFQSDNVFTDLPNGEYTVIVMDANGCTTSISVTVAVNTLVVDFTIEQGILCDSETAIISVQASGGTPPYQYSIDGENFQDSNIFEVPPGTYVFTVLDSEGFTRATESITIEGIEQLALSVEVFATSISINAVGGTPPYLYSIDGGTTFSNENIFDDLENGTFPIVVEDANGCRIEAVAEVNVITSIEIFTTPPSCSDGDAVLTVGSVEGGIPPYQYSLDGGDFQDEPVFEGLLSGEHTIAVMDANGYIFELIFNITIPTPLEAMVEVMEDDLIIAVSGGTPPYQYSIDGGMTFEPNPDFTDLPNGDYDVVVEDANGCQVMTTVTVNVSGIEDLVIDLLFEVQPNPNHGTFTMVLNQPTQRNLDISIFDALGRVVYNEKAIKTTSHFQHPITVGDLSAGVYFLKVTDGKLLGSQQIVIIE